ncbi:MAG: CDP-diacylglycerol--serine O-phosphatidyltransferase [Elusimicrobiota bacterium]
MKDGLKRSGRVLAPSVFTMCNMCCGFFAIMSAHIGDFTAAGTAILGGIVFDMLDGRVARWVHGESSFGVEFDSLADFLTFCVAPATVMCALLLKDYGFFGYASAFLFALCGGLRLARFNAVSQAGKGSKTHFQGLPTPAAAGLLASFVLLYEIVERGGGPKTMGFVMHQIPNLAGLGPVLMVTLSFLMVSNVPYGAFKQPDMLRPHNIKRLVAVGVTLTLLYIYPQNAIFLLFLLYVASGLTGLVFRGRRRAERHH